MDTSLEVEADQALTLYRKRASSDQHITGNSRPMIDMERLLSGKFAVKPPPALGILIYNMPWVAPVNLVVARMLG